MDAIFLGFRTRINEGLSLESLQADRQEYNRQCCVVNNLIKSLKSSYYTTIITENSSDQRVLFNTVSKLLQKQSTARYPSSCSDALANSFADYFIDKIDRIHATLIEKNSAQGNDANEVTLGNYVECNSVFSDFINVSYEDIKGLALRSINKSCVLDPLPAGGKDIAFGNYGPAWRYHRKLLITAIRQHMSDQKLLEKAISE